MKEKNEHSTAPAPEPDLLRVKAYSLTAQEEAALSSALLAQIHKAIVEMPASQLQDIAQFVDLMEHNYGCASPAETFIRSLVNTHYTHGLTPEEVATHLDPENSDGFRYNFDEAIEIARRIRRTYSQLVA